MSIYVFHTSCPLNVSGDFICSSGEETVTYSNSGGKIYVGLGETCGGNHLIFFHPNQDTFDSKRRCFQESCRDKRRQVALLRGDEDCSSLLSSTRGCDGEEALRTGKTACTKPSGTLSLDFSASRLWEINACFSSWVCHLISPYLV